MKIMLVGGGSGGHLTPLLAVAHELKSLNSEVELVYIGHRGDDLHALVLDRATVSRAHTIYAGKLRRYHGEGWRQLLDITTLLKNLRDGFLMLLGLLQSLVIVKREKPAVLFIKGGFVGVPVGLAARLWRIPYITHDSDALPGLANRILSKKATLHAVALPKELYKYPAEKTVEVGVPVGPAYKKVSTSDMIAARKSLGIPSNASILFVTGGGLGAERVNKAILAAAPELFANNENLIILHQAGKKNEDATASGYRDNLKTDLLNRVKVFGFTDKMAELSAAADVVVSRAGATNLAEMALQAKAVILVPNPMLTGGHQLKNAEAFAAADACVIVPESRLNSVGDEITKLLKDKNKRSLLEANIHKFAKKDAAKKTAEIILQAAGKKER